MNMIDNEIRAAADQARAPKARTRWSVLLRPAYALPAVALVAAAAIGAVVVAQPDGDGGAAVTTEPAQFAAPQAGSPKGVAELANRMALVSADRNRPAPTGNWVYIKSKYTNFSIDKTKQGNKPVSTVADRQSWMSLDGLHGWYVEKGSGQDPDGTAITTPDEPPNVGAPSYRLLSSLPDDPDALLTRIRRDTQGQGNNPDSIAFDTIGSMLMESYPPAKLYPALYRTAAKIPGALLVDDAVDATGRHGIALARVDEIGMRTELIFDQTDYTFLGRRVVATKDLEDGTKAGTVTYSNAILHRTLVDSMKEVPAN